jgi:hypothetical protein
MPKPAITTTTAEFSVEAGLSHTIPLEVPSRDCVLEIHFKASFALHYALHYADEADFEWRWQSEETTTLLCPRKGRLLFEFSNKKAWLASSIVQQRCTLHPPLHAALESPISIQLASPFSSKVLLDCSQLSTSEILASG